MPRRIPQRDPIAADQRRATAARRAGINARCRCGEDGPEALVVRGKEVICVECGRKNKGKTIMDKHHIAGKASSPITISIPANDHRARLSVDQHDWPARTLENPDRSPLLKAAACIRGFIDTVQYLIEELLLWIADLLEKVDAYFDDHSGSKWWCGTEFQQFPPKENSDEK
jgi:hypothetical protein